MAWTQSNLDALDAAILLVMQGGARVVQFGDRRIEFHSVEEMLKFRQLMLDEVGTIAGTRVSVSYASHSKE